MDFCLLVHGFIRWVGIWIYHERLAKEAMSDERKYSMEEFKQLFRHNLAELVDAYCSDHLSVALEAVTERILAKQRKDVADELVRILIERVKR